MWRGCITYVKGCIIHVCTEIRKGSACDRNIRGLSYELRGAIVCVKGSTVYVEGD